MEARLCAVRVLEYPGLGSLDGGMCAAVPRVRMSLKSSLSLGTQELPCCPSEERQEAACEGIKYLLFLKHEENKTFV